MKNHFVANGSRRLWLGKRALASKSNEQNYAIELTNADPAEQKIIRERMVEELAHHENVLNHRPSAGTLW
jgi:hypothetical protein